MDIPFLSGTQRGKRIALFDIGSASVGFAVVELNGDDPARVVASKRAKLALSERTEGQRISGLRRLFDEEGPHFFAEVTRRGFTDIEKGLVIVHAPLMQTRSAKASREFRAPQKITHDIIGSLAHQALTQPDGAHDDAAAEVFERTVIRVELNGYATAHPEGKVAEKIETTLVVSTMPAELKTMVRDGVGKLLPGRTLTVRSSLTLYSMLLRDIATRANDYTILDMTSVATACIGVRDGVVTQHAVIAAGTQTLLEVTAKESAVAPDEVFSLIRLATEDACETTQCEAIAKAVAKAERKLVRMFGEGFSTVVGERRLPNLLVVAVHPDLAVWARGFFDRLDFSQFTVTGRPFSVQVISAEGLERFATVDAEAVPDSTLVAGAAFARVLER